MREASQKKKNYKNKNLVLASPMKAQLAVAD